MISNYQDGEGWDPINQFNHPTFLCLCQARTWIRLCVCAKPGHGYISVFVLSQDMDTFLCLCQARTWIRFCVCAKPGHGYVQWAEVRGGFRCFSPTVSMQCLGERAKTGWFGIRIICPSEVHIYLPTVVSAS